MSEKLPPRPASAAATVRQLKQQRQAAAVEHLRRSSKRLDASLDEARQSTTSRTSASPEPSLRKIVERKWGDGGADTTATESIAASAARLQSRSIENSASSAVGGADDVSIALSVKVDTRESVVEPAHVFAQRTMSALESQMRSKYRRGAAIPEEERFDTYARVMRAIAQKLPQVGATITTCLTEMTAAFESFSLFRARSDAAEKKLAQFERDLGEHVEAVKVGCQREITSVIRGISDRDDEIRAALRAAELLRERVAELEEERRANLATIAEQSLQLRDQARELSLKRAMLKELQSKANAIVQENKYLRSICAHNADLLKEIDTMKESHLMHSESREELIKRLQAEVAELREERGAFSTQLKGLKVLITHQLDEITLLRQTNNELQGICDEARVQRDRLMSTTTPRPAQKDALSAIDAAATAMGITLSSAQQLRAECPIKIKSTVLVETLRKTLEELTTEYKLLKMKHAVQSRVVEFLRDDDFEHLQDLGMPSIMTGESGEAADSPRVSKMANTSATTALGVGTTATRAFPLRSTCVVAPGMWDPAAPVPLQCTGLVPVRSMPLEEVLLLIDALLRERRGQLESMGLHGANNVKVAQRPSLPQLVLTFFAGRAGNGASVAAVYELTFSFMHSLELCSYAPQVEAFRRVLSMRCAEEAFGESLELVDVVFVALRALMSRLGSQAEKKRRFIKRRVVLETIQKAVPWFSEADMLRLKAVIYAECLRHGYGDGAGSTIKLGRDDLPLEVLLDGHVREADGDLASLGIVEHVVGSCVLSPFGAALFRLIFTDFELFASEITAAVMKAVTVTPSSGGVPMQSLALDGTVVSAAQLAATMFRNAVVTPQTLFEVIPSVDRTKTVSEIQRFVNFIFVHNADGSEGDVRKAAMPFLDFAQRCSLYYWTRGAVAANSAAATAVQPMEANKLAEAASKSIAKLVEQQQQQQAGSNATQPQQRR